jgi:hypothetical protein
MPERGTLPLSSRPIDLLFYLYQILGMNLAMQDEESSHSSVIMAGKEELGQLGRWSGELLANNRSR